ncbi:hypothetical protein QBC33DRAFT_622604 [Phialemonium atrogriseum]|uniref:WD-like domain-containing protein n=1 Tax=Phialemonium atrogriseum TaxID=1093897 RepID=A0AAJ0FCS9_9PEZI|nr:uncharacterized protein QBC33DRAFT_622604 [Phialemonium atrogriseum]KAK1763901.1 hypothetical protein QBC33DRAFT_622604 [Phialemonium atrogriseum]
MMFGNAAAAFILTGMVGMKVAGHVLPRADTTPDGLIVIDVSQDGNNTLTWYADVPGSEAKRSGLEAAGAPLEARACGSVAVSCFGSNLADATNCANLISALRRDPFRQLSQSPRAVCLGQGGGECCVSWSKAVSGLEQGDLLNGANFVLQDCLKSGNRVSGLTRNVQLQSSCVTECLSNRPDGCS